jgi:heterotetrameric sarcosine oxidase delta subunit
MLIPCPWCGERAHREFAYGGDATVRRPARPDEASDSDWYAYLYLRQNPRGPHRELWFHEFGCEQWVEVERDTLTHAVTSVNAAGQRPRSAP